jgi:hypothetical protein
MKMTVGLSPSIVLAVKRGKVVKSTGIKIDIFENNRAALFAIFIVSDVPS